jgi:lambda family phage minor tail protein L
MGKGQDKIAISLMDLQPTAIVEFFLLYFNTIDREDSFIAFHGGSNFNKGIVWQGITYLPVPVETEGFEINANSQMPRPKIRISNKDYFVTDMLIRNSDFQYSKVIRKRTFVKYIDDVNFDGGNPWGEADASAEISNESYIISQKTAENKNFVEFELTSPLDLDNFELNNRLILSRYCSWVYRGPGCNYNGSPIQTEDGVDIIYKVPEGPQTQSQLWSQGTDYKIGDAVYLENKRIKIAAIDSNTAIIPADPIEVTDATVAAEQEAEKNASANRSDYVKIWFVAKQNHKSSDATKPDDNSSYWIKDGCSKKLSACKLRFTQKSYFLQRLDDVKITNQYVDFSFKKTNPTNNVALDFAGITGDVIYLDNTASYAVDDNPNTYWAGGTINASGNINLPNLPSCNINRINLYDSTDSLINYGTGYAIFSGTTVTTGTVGLLPTDGSMKSTGNFNFTNVTGVSIRSSGTAGVVRGLSQIDLIDNGQAYGLYNETFKTDGVHKGEGFLIGMWGEFPSGVNDAVAFNLFHNVNTGCQYSGINLYLSGNLVICDFATTSIRDDIASAPGTRGPVVISNQSITGSYPQIFNQSKFCLFLENYQFNSNSTGELNSRLIIYDQNKEIIAQYSPSIKNIDERYSGESFLFKDPLRQNGINNLHFGVNQWQDYVRGITYTSPMLLGSTAIWTSALTESDTRQDLFTANRSGSNNAFSNFNGLGDPSKAFALNYNQLEAASVAKNNLYAWWDMDLPTIPSAGYYKINNSHSTTPPTSRSLILTGIYFSGLEKVIPTTVSQYKFIENATPTIGLPFGGFPATDRYGR